MPARTTKSYQGRIVGGMGARQNGVTIHKQRTKTTRLRTNAEGAVQCTGTSAKVTGGVVKLVGIYRDAISGEVRLASR